jgi:hypothetical protein
MAEKQVKGGKIITISDSSQPYAPAALYSPETLLFFCFWYSFMLEAE